MKSEIFNWLITVISSSGLVGVAAYLLRDTVVKYLTKSVEHKFETKLEKFKADIRDSEKEIEHIRSFLASNRRERDSLIQSKRIQAAENLLRARDVISQMTLLVEYMKILNISEIFKDAGNPKIGEFIDTLTKPLNTEEKIKSLGSIDMGVPRLYLSDKSLKLFDTYKGIVLHAAMMMQAMRVPLRNLDSIMKPGVLSESVIDLAPMSKEGFDKWGESYAYFWASYFHDELLRSLRKEIWGEDNETLDTKSVEQLALDSRRAQINVRASLEKMGLPNSLISAKDETG